MSNDKSKEKFAAELESDIRVFLDSIRAKLKNADMRYQARQETAMMLGQPFDGGPKKICDAMVIDMICDYADNVTLSHCLHTTEEINKAVSEYEDYHSPASRIARHIEEVERLKEKYGVTESEIQKHLANESK